MSSTNLPMIAAEMLGEPLVIHPAKARILLSVLGPRINIEAEKLEDLKQQPEMTSFVGMRSGNGAYRVESRTAIIPVHGTLVNRGAWISPYSGATSYEGISEAFRRAIADEEVTRIVMDINSPGGAVGGIVELGEQIKQVQKPVIAVVNDMACSAAYWLAAQADKILIGKTGIVGSIGVVFLHVDHSGALDQAGLKPTFIIAGDHKIDGTPYEPLPKEVQADIQERIDRVYTLFVQAVSESRSELSEEDVRGTEAQVYSGQAGIDAGLADKFGSLRDAIKMELDEMTVKNDNGTAIDTGTESGMVSQEQVGVAVAGAREDGAVAAQTRIKGILEHLEAEGRSSMAKTLAFETTMSVDEAGKLLATAPKEIAPDADNENTATDAKAAAELAAEGAASYVGEDGKEAATTGIPDGLNPSMIYENRRNGGR